MSIGSMGVSSTALLLFVEFDASQGFAAKMDIYKNYFKPICTYNMYFSSAPVQDLYYLPSNASTGVNVLEGLESLVF